MIETVAGPVYPIPELVILIVEIAPSDATTEATAPEPPPPNI